MIPKNRLKGKKKTNGTNSIKDSFTYLESWHQQCGNLWHNQLIFHIKDHLSLPSIFLSNNFIRTN
jgi:hypothetical protein